MHDKSQRGEAVIIPPPPDLTPDAVEAWGCLLPPDVREACLFDRVEEPKGVDGLRVPDDLCGPKTDQYYRALGRPGRMRLLVWVARASWPHGATALEEMLGDAEQPDSAGRMLQADIDAFSDLIARRILRRLAALPEMHAGMLAVNAFGGPSPAPRDGSLMALFPDADFEPEGGPAMTFSELDGDEPTARNL